MVGKAKLMVTTLANLVGQIHQKNLEVRDQIKGNYGQIYSQIHQKKLDVGQTQLFLPMSKFRQCPIPKVLPYQSVSEGRSHKPVDRKVERGIHQL